jgi:hypothetical protein
MNAADPNWKGEGIFKRIIEVSGLFVHKDTNEIILETEGKLWTEREIIGELGYGPFEFKNFIKIKNWNKLFYPYSHTEQFGSYWKEALAEIVEVNQKYKFDETVLMRAVRDYGGSNAEVNAKMTLGKESKILKFS